MMRYFLISLLLSRPWTSNPLAAQDHQLQLESPPFLLPRPLSPNVVHSLIFPPLLTLVERNACLEVSIDDPISASPFHNSFILTFLSFPSGSFASQAGHVLP
ncbi:hypothetical protein IE53DRAFT_66825 [Violaceomyces palustris]|uniref:Uncharacterized protein n=1 Tax=Violaceomyces palustris TaxID=1673888 RepID=A0ACD0NYX7_9BASI|nr:hypothetical protein IE53DRAFT_66825 [Violaceomyces palustris]